LTNQIKEAKTKLESLHIAVTVSEMAYGYQVVGELFRTLSLMVLTKTSFQREGEGSMNVMAAIDFIDAHMLPFFSQEASTCR
jgi:hypothetical protein